jgi:hypothetical protein
VKVKKKRACWKKIGEVYRSDSLFDFAANVPEEDRMLALRQQCEHEMDESFHHEYAYNSTSKGKNSLYYTCVDHGNINCPHVFQVSFHSDSCCMVMKEKGEHISDKLVAPEFGIHPQIKNKLKELRAAGVTPLLAFMCLEKNCTDKTKHIIPTKVQIKSYYQTLARQSKIFINNITQLSDFLSRRSSPKTESEWSSLPDYKMFFVNCFMKTVLNDEDNTSSVVAGFICSCKSMLQNIINCEETQRSTGMVCFVDGTYK